MVRIRPILARGPAGLRGAGQGASIVPEGPEIRSIGCPGHFFLQPGEDPAQPADPQHPQDLGQANPLDQVAPGRQDLLDGRPAEPFDQDRDEASDRRGLDRGVGMDRHPVPLRLHEQEDRRLAFLHPVLGVLQLLEPVGQRGEVLGEVDQEFDPLLTIGVAQFGNDGVECGGQLHDPRGQSTDRVRIAGPDLPERRGARSRGEAGTPIRTRRDYPA